jgi:hypothetical protein
MMTEVWESEAKLNGINPETGGEFEANVSRDMMHLALTVISAAAFGVRLDWEMEASGTKKQPPKGHKMSFQRSLELLMERLMFWIVTPRILFSLPIRYLNELKDAVDGKVQRKRVRQIIKCLLSTVNLFLFF